jgi:hypothetical protein
MLDNTFFSGECKWWNTAVGQDVLEHLQEVTRGNSYYAQRKGEPHYLLFSRSAFSDEVRELGAEDRRILLVGPRELLALLPPPNESKPRAGLRLPSRSRPSRPRLRFRLRSRSRPSPVHPIQDPHAPPGRRRKVLDPAGRLTVQPVAQVLGAQ